MKKYKIIYADPPWRFKVWSGPEKKIASRGTVAPYKTLEIEEIKSIPVKDWTDEDCALFLWIVWPTMPEALSVIDAWGFKYKTCAFTWMKANPYKLWALEEDVYMGLGYWTRANSEVCLLATKGNPRRVDNGVRQGIIEPRREHSRKPDELADRIVQLCGDVPRLEMFARTRRPGWDQLGDELDKFRAAE